MRPKSIILIVIALGCGLVASIGISQVMANRGGGPAPTETVSIAVATKPVSIGDELTEEMFKLESWPKDRVPEGAITTAANVKGRRPAQRLYAGEPIIELKLIDDLGATKRIPPGYKVHTITVSPEDIHGGLLQPGDRVDVRVYLRKSVDVPEPQTKTLLKDVNVWALNDRTERTVGNEDAVIKAKTVSLLVKPDQVSKLLLATQLGEVSLTMRGSDDEEDDSEQDMTVSEFLGIATDQASAGAAAPTPPVEPTPPVKPANSFLNFLANKGQQALTAPAPPARLDFHMDIMTPTGVERWQFGEDGELPQQVHGAQSGSTPPAAQSGFMTPPATAEPTQPSEAELDSPADDDQPEDDDRAEDDGPARD